MILLSWLLLNQIPVPLAWLGGAVCLAGTVITQLRQPVRSPPAADQSPGNYCPPSGGTRASPGEHELNRTA